MNTFNNLSNQDQLEIAAYIAQCVLLMVGFSVVIGSSLLMTMEHAMAPMRYGCMMVWACFCGAAALTPNANAYLAFWIYSLGMVVPRVLWWIGSKLIQKGRETHPHVLGTGRE